MQGFLYEFKDLDLPNAVRVVASFVLLQWRTDNQSLAEDIWNFGMKKKSGKRVSRKDAKAARCHFDRREKSFLDPSHSLGMTDFGPSPCVLGVPSPLLRTCLAR